MNGLIKLTLIGVRPTAYAVREIGGMSGCLGDSAESYARSGTTNFSGLPAACAIRSAAR
jgi:hypothetical protein